MLEYCKTILAKVSFDTDLFQKELMKSLKFVSNQEKKELIRWCEQQFPSKTKSVIC